MNKAAENTINSACHASASTAAQGPGNLLRTFTHDPLRRLLSATGRESSNVYAQPSWDLNIRPQDRTATNTSTRTYDGACPERSRRDKIGNIQTLRHVANGKANQNFNRAYSYGAANNFFQSFDIASASYANTYNATGDLTTEGSTRYYGWGSNTKLATFKNQVGNSTPTVYTNYFYNAQGERIKKHTRKGNLIEVTFYLDVGLFETSYVKPICGGIVSNRFYNTLHIKDGTSLIAAQRVGTNQPDATPAVMYNIGDENWSGYSFFCGQSQSGYFRIINHIQCRGYGSVLKF